jgi:predicted flap endonuclease-1-like 5' DNA nuclease
VRDPAAGLNPIARDAIAALLIYAAKGFALILDRAITEAAVEPPEVSLTAETLLAGLKMPAKWITKKITDAETRRQVQAMYDELMATGHVDATLPEDDRVVRDLYTKEVLAPRKAAKARERANRLAQVSPAATLERQPSAAKPAALAGPREITRLVTAHRHRSHAETETEPRFHLRESDELERAPTIGPRLAERLALGGIVTVKDFLNAEAETVASLLGGGRFDAATIERWKCESRLVLSVPGLRGSHAQLLAGAGYDTPQKIAEADPAALSSALLTFATTADGARILRNGDAPDLEAVTRWVHNAQQGIAA